MRFACFFVDRRVQVRDDSLKPILSAENTDSPLDSAQKAERRQHEAINEKPVPRIGVGPNLLADITQPAVLFGIKSLLGQEPGFEARAELSGAFLRGFKKGEIPAFI